VLVGLQVIQSPVRRVSMLLLSLSDRCEPPLRHYLKYAVHETMVQASFAAVFLLKIAILFPTQVTAKFISTEVADLANLMSECAAERYALTLRLMLRSFRRKMGETTMAPGTPRTMANGQVAGPSVDGMIPGHRGLESLLSMDGDSAVDFSILDDLGPFNWPEDGFSPSNLPQWITEGVRILVSYAFPEHLTDELLFDPAIERYGSRIAIRWIRFDLPAARVGKHVPSRTNILATRR
jgi:hypothetical protein